MTVVLMADDGVMDESSMLSFPDYLIGKPILTWQVGPGICWLNGFPSPVAS